MRTHLLISDADKHLLRAGEGVGFLLLPVSPTEAGQVPGRYPVQLRIGTGAPLDIDGPHVHWTNCRGPMELITQQVGEAWRLIEIELNDGGVQPGDQPVLLHTPTGATARALEGGSPAGDDGNALPLGARRLALYFGATANTAKLVMWWKAPTGAWFFAQGWDFTAGTPSPVQIVDVPPGATRFYVQKVAGGAVTVTATAEF